MTNFVRKVIRTNRVWNWLHFFRIVRPIGQSLEPELDCLARFSTGRGDSIEIGTKQGASAERIAKVIRLGAKLYCVDPWLSYARERNRQYDICLRHLRRAGVADRVVILRGTSKNMESRMPDGADFIFVDGDHSWQGIETDWNIVSRKLRVNGIVCLHDTTAHSEEPHGQLESCRFYRDVILRDSRFKHLETCYSLNVLQRIA